VRCDGASRARLCERSEAIQFFRRSGLAKRSTECLSQALLAMSIEHPACSNAISTTVLKNKSVSTVYARPARSGLSRLPSDIDQAEHRRHRARCFPAATLQADRVPFSRRPSRGYAPHCERETSLDAIFAAADRDRPPFETEQIHIFAMLGRGTLFDAATENVDMP